MTVQPPQLPKSEIMRKMSHALGFRGLEASITASPLNKIIFITDTALTYPWDEKASSTVLFLNLQATAIACAYEYQSDNYTIISCPWDKRLFEVRSFYPTYFEKWDSPYPCYDKRAMEIAGGQWKKDPAETFKARTLCLMPSGLGMMKSLFCQYANPIAQAYRLIMEDMTSMREGIGESKEIRKGGVRYQE